MGNKVAIASETRVVTVGEIKEENRRKDNRIKTSKYTIYGFLFQNVYEQFRRFANFYFLMVSIIAVIIDSPVSPLTSIAPLAFVLIVTMIKQGYEDWLRHRSDHVVNNEIVNVIRNSTLQPVKSHEICPGEIIRISRDCDVPCDAVLLWTSDSRGKCFVTTANLDGETSLKPLKVPQPLLDTSIDFLKGNKIDLECVQPEADIYTFYGKISTGNEIQFTLGIDNLLLRGSRVKNTEWAICCAVYTGKETKLSLNSRITRNKFTSSESYINKFLLFYLVVLIVEMGISLFIKRYLESIYSTHELYIGDFNTDNSFQSFSQDIFSFMLLYFYCIPISLYVTIELQKFIGSLYFNWDLELICSETKQPALANSSDLNEELGQVEILFSDKTGTLTKNDMYFQMCSVNGELYVERDNKLYEMNLSWYTGETVEAIESLKPDLNFFFTILALCHAVQVEEESHNVHEINNNSNSKDNNALPPYQSMSSDEIAFVKAAANRGIVYYGEESNKMLIKLENGEIEKYEKLQVLEFSSARKRMSVIVRDKNGKIWLFCKGAESSIIPLCNDNLKIVEINSHVQFFAERGLRTLAVAYKELTEDEYADICREIIRINMDVHGRASNAERWRSLEEGLTLLGATGVEDRLQDDVVETLEALREAGIKIWVLTGDKIETAINVAQSCGHIPSRSEKLFLTEILTSESLESQLNECIKVTDSEEDSHLTLVVDGQTFALIIGSRFQDDFVNMSLKCKAVICCRLSPIQKSQIVRVIKKSKARPVTAAIGDGANDISMIQEAHVGFGIFGREGRQAARCADFSFKKFMMIKRILLVHGHWYYQRLGTLVQYSFYKNFLFVNLMLFFQIDSFFSSQSIFDSMFLMLFNVTFAAVPIFVLSLTEQCHPANTLQSQPLLYKKQVDKKLLSWPNFIGWTFLGVYHSVVIYYSLYALWYDNSTINSDGLPAGQWCFGAALFANLVIVINLKLWLITRYNAYIYIFTVLITIGLLFLILNVYSAIYIIYDGDVLWTFIRLEESLTFWMATVLITVACLLPDYLTLVYKSLIRKHVVKEPVHNIETVELDITKL